MIGIGVSMETELYRPLCNYNNQQDMAIKPYPSRFKYQIPTNPLNLSIPIHHMLDYEYYHCCYLGHRILRCFSDMQSFHTTDCNTTTKTDNFLCTCIVEIFSAIDASDVPRLTSCSYSYNDVLLRRRLSLVGGISSYNNQPIDNIDSSNCNHIHHLARVSLSR